jgi:hypothetical protein
MIVLDFMPEIRQNILTPVFLVLIQTNIMSLWYIIRY